MQFYFHFHRHDIPNQKSQVTEIVKIKYKSHDRTYKPKSNSMWQNILNRTLIYSIIK